MPDKLIDKAVELLRSTQDTPYKIAKATGLSQTIIGKWKKGEGKIDYAKLGQSLLAQRSCMSSTTKGEDATNRIIIESGDLKPENAA